MFRILPLLFMLAASSAASSPASCAPPAISLDLNPHVGFRPLTVQARVSIEPHYLNVGWCLAWVHHDGVYDGSHCESLQGQYEARTHYYLLKYLPAGKYQAVATLLRVRDAENTPAQSIEVIDSLVR